MPARSEAAVIVAIAASITAIDQLTKAAVVSAIGPLRPESRINIGNGWIALEYAENRGAAFGLFRGLAPVIVAVSVAIVIGLLVHHFRETASPLLSTFGIGAIVGGALGNLIDRFRLGFVVDFVSVGPWPNFNVADSAITIGVLALIWGWMQPGNEVSSSNAG